MGTNPFLKRVQKRPIKYRHQRFFRFAKKENERNRIVEIFQQNGFPVVNWRHFYGTVRMKIKSKYGSKWQVYDMLTQLKALGFEHINFELPRGKKRTILMAGSFFNDYIQKMTPEEHAPVSLWLKREEFELPEDAIRKRKGSIHGVLIHDKRHQLICTIYWIGLRDMRRKPDYYGGQYPYIWIDFVPGRQGEKVAKLIGQEQIAWHGESKLKPLKPKNSHRRQRKLQFPKQ